MTLEKYVDPLPIPKVLKPKGLKDGAIYYEVTMKQFSQKLHRDLPETVVWGYEGTYPGPTFEVKRNEPIQVKWINNLPINEHLLPVDTTVHGAGPEYPRVRTVVHVHGANTPPESDGYPEAWFTKGFQQTGPYFTQEVYQYPNGQPATTLWYHDHALGITRLNVYAGLSGFYIIREDSESDLNLPKGKYELPLLIQDRSLNQDGSLFYPAQPDSPVPGVNPSIVPEFFGDTILVNGKIWPYLEVEPRKYRFRLLNGSNSRFYRLRLDSTQPFYQIGTDGGLLEETVLINELILGPAERADIIIDFTNLPGEKILLTNDAPAPFPSGAPVDVNTTGQIMQFRVMLPLSGQDTSKIPEHLTKIDWLIKSEVKKIRDLQLIESTDQYGRLLLLLGNKMWDDPTTEKPILGTTEIWHLINVTMDTHPIHLHLVQFQIIDRQPFMINNEGNIIPTGTSEPPAPNEKGWKDTIRANPGEITRIIVRFGDFAGQYVWHCHILEHEDYEMMRPYMVVKKHQK